MKITLYVLILFLTFGITLARETLSRFGLDTNYLLIALLAMVFTGLLAYRGLLLVVLVLLLAVAINLPPDFIGGLQMDQDVLIASLIAIIILPLAHRVLLR